MNLPEVTEILRTKITPGDTVVLKVPSRLNLEQHDRLLSYAREVFVTRLGAADVVLFDSEISIEVCPAPGV